MKQNPEQDIVNFSMFVWGVFWSSIAFSFLWIISNLENYCK